MATAAARTERPPRRRREDQAWTVGEHNDYADAQAERFDRIERKIDRLTWMVATGCGIVATAAFALGILGTLFAKLGG
jgi:hypothetical protein